MCLELLEERMKNHIAASKLDYAARTQPNEADVVKDNIRESLLDETKRTLQKQTFFPTPIELTEIKKETTEDDTLISHQKP